MSEVFTILCHGTRYSRSSGKEELINQLHNALSGYEARIVPRKDADLGYGIDESLGKYPHFLVCEGPGSPDGLAKMPHYTKKVAHKKPGLLNPIFGIEKGDVSDLQENMLKKIKVKKKGWMGGDYEDEEYSKSDAVMDFLGDTKDTPNEYTDSGSTYGVGWRDNVYKAVFMLTHLIFERKQEITVVNLAGWSRGAVTCLMIANAIYDVFGDELKVNIFAVDPVPGYKDILKEADEDMYTIPGNVKNYLCILALNDYRKYFSPTDKSVTKQADNGTNVVFLPLPGHHTDVVEPRKEDDPLFELLTGYKLSRHLAAAALKKWGTDFRKHSLGMTEEECLEEYDKLLGALPGLRKKIKDEQNSYKDITSYGGIADRAFTQKMEDYTPDPDEYINVHHYHCKMMASVDDLSFKPAQMSDELAAMWVKMKAMLK